MIFTQSILGGYVIFKGTIMFHIPMVIAMFFFVDIPDETLFKEAYPGTWNFAYAWYWMTIVLHGLFTLWEVALILRLDKVNESAYNALLLIFRYAQMFNICVMLMLYCTGQTEGTFEQQKIKDFNFWLLIELLVNLVIFLNAILYLMVRSLLRDPPLSFASSESNSGKVDMFEDYMSGNLRQQQINVFSQACMPMAITTILKYFFLNQEFIWSMTSSAASLTFLDL